MSRAELLLEEHADDLSVAISRPLLVAMTDGTVPAPVFARYLALEEGFVATAAGLVARLLSSEYDSSTRAHLERILHELRDQQSEYFLAETGRGETRSAASAAPDDPLSRYALGLVARYGDDAVPVCLAAAETLYSGWCTRAAAVPTARPPAVQTWIELHSTASFAEGAAFWLSMVDRLPPDDPDDVLLSAWFSGMLAAENAFHDAAYEGEPA
ncbi:hypothetical protein [Microbacterium tumbae]